MSDSLASIYTGALLADTEKVFCKQLEWVNSVFYRHPELMDILSMSEISLEEKKKNLDEIFKEELDPQLFNMLILLASNKRLHLLDSIYQELLKKVNEADHVKTGKIISAFPLGEKKIQSIEEHFSNLLRTQIRLSFVLDESLIGGVTVIIGDKVYDGSIHSQLRKMKEYISGS